MFLSIRSWMRAGTSISSQSRPVKTDLIGSRLCANWNRLCCFFLKSIGLSKREAAASFMTSLLLSDVLSFSLLVYGGGVFIMSSSRSMLSSFLFGVISLSSLGPLAWDEDGWSSR